MSEQKNKVIEENNVNNDNSDDYYVDPEEYIKGERQPEAPPGSWIASVVNKGSLFVSFGASVAAILLGFFFQMYFLLALSVLVASGCLGFWVAGLKPVQEQDRWIVEVFGAYDRILKPGLNHKVATTKIESTRGPIGIWEQDIKLFRDLEDGEWSIDFQEGGTAVPRKPIIWVELIGDPRTERGEEILDESVKRVFYEVRNWRVMVRSNSEQAFRDIANNIVVERAMSLGKDLEGQEGLEGESFLVRMRKEIAKKKEKIEWWDLMNVTTDPPLEETFKQRGLRVTRLTLGDFKWDERVKDIRRRVFQEMREIEIAKYSVEAAKHEARERAIKIGQPPAEIARFLREEYSWTKKKATRTALDLTMYFEGVEEGQLYDYRGGLIGKGGPESSGQVFSGLEELIADKSSEVIDKVKERFFSDLDQ